MMTELLVIITVFLMRLIQSGGEVVCMKLKNTLWVRLVYICTSILMSAGLILFLKENWIEKIGLHKSAMVVVIVSISVFYFIFMMARFLQKVNDDF